MSRAPVDDPRDTMEEMVEKNLEVCFTIRLEEQIMMIQHSDPELRDLIQIFRKDPCDRTVREQNRINDYSYKGGRLFRVVKNGEEERALYVIPTSMRKSLVVKLPDLMGHFAVDRTVNKIEELYWFPSMKRYVRRHVARCVECLFNKVPGGKQQGFLHPIKPAKRPFSIVHMDHVGPFVRSTRGNQEPLVIVDNLTRFVRLSPVRNTSTQNVLKVMKSFVNDFGLPDKIISERGSCFTSRQFEEFCRGNGIHHTLNSTKHPQGNGMVERVNRTVLSTIATGIEDPRRKDWDLKIKEVRRDLNNAMNKTTNKTPFETLHGYSPRFHDGILRRLADEDMDPWTEPERIQESVRPQIENKQEIMKTYYDKKKCRTLQFEVGEIVVMRHVPKMTGEPTKAQPKYRGPLIITEVLPSDTYRVTQLSERTGGREEDDSATEESLDEESEEEDTLRRNPRRSSNAKFKIGIQEWPNVIKTSGGAPIECAERAIKGFCNGDRGNQKVCPLVYQWQPIQHENHIPIPKTVQESYIKKDDQHTAFADDHQLEDPEFISNESGIPHLFDQASLNDLVRDLRLSKEAAEIIGSRLKQRNLFINRCENDWLALIDVVKHFLGNNKSPNYARIVEDMTSKFHKLECISNLKFHFMDSHVNLFPDNLGAESEKQGERFHQDIKIIEQRYNGLWNQHMEGTTDRRVRSHPPQCTTSRENREIVRMAVTDRSVTSRTVAQHIQSVTHYPVSARTIRRRLQQSRLSATRPFLRLPLSQNHKRLRRQWCDERRMWMAEWNEIVFTDEQRFCLQHHDGRIRVWRHREERMLTSCVMHRHTGPAPGIMVWGGIGYHSRTPLVRIPVLPTAIFQQDDARSHVARIVQRYFVNRQIELLAWPARSPELLPIENMWPMVAQ
ncbi:hypothetical protein LAZ67_5002219 [Cordylochernes scorpioides]|uniref:RNA-directed DNA polymerase n=1 Tax=Cordylochernes scorpioides TaxID=51811 RepID=A0ABY6KJ56_9ARAC|nr:hypothetical protein LAZ67_5002219 [Cordylochernes scorpioides]